MKQALLIFITFITFNPSIIFGQVLLPPNPKISATPNNLLFGTQQTSDKQPTEKTVDVINTGNRTVTLRQPNSANYEIGTLSRKILKPMDTAIFTVRPKARLNRNSASF